MVKKLSSYLVTFHRLSWLDRTDIDILKNFFDTYPEAYLEQFEHLRWDFLAKIVTWFQPFTNFAKKFHRRCSIVFSTNTTDKIQALEEKQTTKSGIKWKHSVCTCADIRR